MSSEPPAAAASGDSPQDLAGAPAGTPPPQSTPRPADTAARQRTSSASAPALAPPDPLASPPSTNPPPPVVTPPIHPQASPPPTRHPWEWAHLQRQTQGHTTTTLVLSVIVALLSGLVLGAGTIGAIWAMQPGPPVASDSASEKVASEDDAPEEPPALAEDVLPGELDQILAFIEDERGLEFVEGVEVQFVDSSEFADAWFTPIPGYEPTEGPSDYGSTYAALGLTPSPDDFYDAERSGSVDGLLGFYDPWTNELYVRGTEWTPVVEGTVVHELTHALQDQHFELDDLLVPSDFDADLALRSLIEGDANRVEYAYYWDQTHEWRDAYDELYADLYSELSSGPYDPLLEMIGAIPYWLGDDALPLLVDQGNADVDAALADPPTSTAEVAEIRRFVRGEFQELVQVEPPTAPNDADVIDEGTLGVAFLELLHLDVDVDWFGSDYLAGWSGDRYVTWTEGDGACTIVSIGIALPSTDEAEGYFAPWARRTGGTVEPLPDDSGVMLTSCGEW